MSTVLKYDTVFAYRDFDLQALCRRASALRQGVPCACDPEKRPASGSFNFAIFISFEDGVRWVFRSPTSTTLPLEQEEKLLASEAATLRYLKAHSDIPVPEVYDYCVSSDNDIGIPFILMSEAPGQQLSDVWKSASHSQPGLEAGEKDKILSQLGAITFKLSQLRFDTIGSLFEEAGSFAPKECLSRGHMLDDRYLLEIPRGPFGSETEFYNNLISALSEHAETMPLLPHCFVAPVPTRDEYQSYIQYQNASLLWNDFVCVGDKFDSSKNRLDYVVLADALRDILQKLEPPAVNPGTFPLCHPDLSADNIFVDEDFNITCLIDWAFASSVPDFMLFTMPGLPQYRDELSSEFEMPFIDGFYEVIPKSMDRRTISKYRELWETDKVQVAWKLSRLLTLDSIRDYPLFAAVWEFARGFDQDAGQYFQQQCRLPHYVQLYKEFQKEDIPISEVEKKENDYLGNKVFRKTIARKLTLVSEWNRQYAENKPLSLRNSMFVTSPQLWKWILSFAQDWDDMFDAVGSEIIIEGKAKGGGEREGKEGVMP